jgi:hypothetical protein
MKFVQLCILILTVLFINPVSAGVLIEPLVGYSFGSIKGDQGSGKSESVTGPSFGGRLGYQNLGFQLGLDYLNSSYSVSNNDYSSLKTSEWGGFVGFEFPILLRVYAGYIFSATGATKYDTGAGGDVDLDFQKGSGTKFGIGFTGLPFVDINFEYRKSSYNEYKLAGTKYDDSTNFNAYMISLSFPFVL